MFANSNFEFASYKKSFGMYDQLIGQGAFLFYEVDEVKD